MRVRAAVTADATGIARVHVASWQAAYRGLMPQDVLDGLSIADRAERWVGIIDDPHPLTLATLVAADGDEIVGWVSFGAGRDEGTDAAGEIYGLYAHPASWSRGVGHALMGAAETALREAGHHEAFLWVLDGNDRADAFYARHGWQLDGGTKIDERPDLTLREHRRAKRLG